MPTRRWMRSPALSSAASPPGSGTGTSDADACRAIARARAARACARGRIGGSMPHTHISGVGQGKRAGVRTTQNTTCAQRTAIADRLDLVDDKRGACEWRRSEEQSARLVAFEALGRVVGPAGQVVQERDVLVRRDAVAQGREADDWKVTLEGLV